MLIIWNHLCEIFENYKVLQNLKNLSFNKKYDPTICCLQEIHFKYKDPQRLKVNGWRKVYHDNTSQKEAGVAIFQTADFQTRKVIRDK